MSAVEKFPCGCIGVRIAPLTAATLRLCRQHQSENLDGNPATISFRNVPPEKGTPISLASKEWREVEADLSVLVWESEQWRDLGRLLRSLLKPRVQS